MVRIPKAQGVGVVKNLEIEMVKYWVSNASVEQEAIFNATKPADAFEGTASIAST